MDYGHFEVSARRNSHLLHVCLVSFAAGHLEMIVSRDFALIFCRKEQKGREDV